MWLNFEGIKVDENAQLEKDTAVVYHSNLVLPIQNKQPQKRCFIDGNTNYLFANN
jgi:hypothetical protein